MTSKQILIFIIAATAILFNSCSGSDTPAKDHCSDGIQNGDETGVDCGGSCEPCASTASWKEVSAPTVNQIFGIYFPTNQTGWAVGPLGNIMKSTDGGMTWSAQSSPFTGNLWQIEMIDEQTGVIGGSEGIIRTTDGGKNWAIVYNNGSVGGIDFVNSSVGYAAGGDESIVLKTIDGGKTWTELSIGITADPTGYLDVAFFNENYGYVCGTAYTGDAAIMTTDGGATWQEVSTSHPCPIFSVDVFDDKYVRAGGYYFFTTENAGKNWSANLDHISEGKMRASSFISKDEGWIAGENLYIYHTTDGGTSWEKSESTMGDAYMWTLHFNDSQHGWAVGPRSKIYVYSPD